MSQESPPVPPHPLLRLEVRVQQGPHRDIVLLFTGSLGGSPGKQPGQGLGTGLSWGHSTSMKRKGLGGMEQLSGLPLAGFTDEKTEADPRLLPPKAGISQLPQTSKVLQVLGAE